MKNIKEYVEQKLNCIEKHSIYNLLMLHILTLSLKQTSYNIMIWLHWPTHIMSCTNIAK